MDDIVCQVLFYFLGGAHKNAVTDKHCPQFFCCKLCLTVFNKLSLKFSFQFFAFLILWQQINRFEIYQPCSHIDKIAGNIKVLCLCNIYDFQILIDDCDNLNIQNTHFVLADKGEQQIKRTFELVQFKIQLH